MVMTLLRIPVLLLLIGLQPLPVISAAAEQKTDYRVLILQYVEQDKVYLLENLRSRVTNKSEQTIINALLTEDGPQAARLFRKQLQDYPDPAFDSLSKARLAAYQSALSSTGASGKTVTKASFILQFGSFSSFEMRVNSPTASPGTHLLPFSGSKACIRFERKRPSAQEMKPKPVQKNSRSTRLSFG